MVMNSPFTQLLTRKMLLALVFACLLSIVGSQQQSENQVKTEIAILYSTELQDSFDLVISSIQESFKNDAATRGVEIVGYPFEDSDNTYLAMLYVYAKILGPNKRVLMMLTIVDCHATEMITLVANKLGVIHHYIPFQKCTYRVPLRQFTAQQFILGLDNLTDHMSKTAPIKAGSNSSALEASQSSDQLTELTTITTHLAGSLTNLMKASFDIIMALNWVNFHILYDTGYPQTDVLELVNRFSSVRRGPNNESIDVTTSRINRLEDIKNHIDETMRSLPNYTTSGFRRLLVLCSEANCVHFVKEAKIKGVLSVKVNWIFVNPLMNIDESLVKAHDGPENVHSVTVSYFSRSNVECGLHCNKQDLPWLLNLSKTCIERPSVSTTMIYLSDILGEIREWLIGNQQKLSWTTIEENSGVSGETLVYTSLLQTTKPSVLESLSKVIADATVRRPLLVYATDTYNQTIRIKDLGVWQTSTPFTLQPTNYTNIKVEMKDVTLRFCTANEEPFLVARPINGTDEYGNPSYAYSGFLMALLKELSARIGFNYTIYHTKDGSGGNKNSATQQWNGIIGELVAKRADVGLMMFVITKERDEAVDFTVPIAEYSADVAIKQQAKDVNNLSNLLLFARPFGWDLWAFIFGFTIVTAFLLHFLQKAHVRIEDAQKHAQRQIKALAEGKSGGAENAALLEHTDGDEEDLEKISLVESIWYTYSAYWGGVPSDWIARCFPARIITVVWWFFGLILLSSYTANLAASLTTNRMEVAVKSLADLAAQTEISFGTTRSSFLSAFFEKENNPPYSSIWLGIQRNASSNLVKNTRAGIEKVNNEKYAFIFGKMALRYFTEEYCDITLLNKPFNQRSYAIALQKGSPYTDILSVEILRLQETGRIEEMLTKQLRDLIEPRREIKPCLKADEGGDAGIEDAQIDFLEMLGIFYVLLFGMVVSLLIVIFELCYTRYRFVKTRKRQMQSAANAAPQTAAEKAIPDYIVQPLSGSSPNTDIVNGESEPVAL